MKRGKGGSLSNDTGNVQGPGFCRNDVSFNGLAFYQQFAGLCFLAVILDFDLIGASAIFARNGRVVDRRRQTGVDE